MSKSTTLMEVACKILGNESRPTLSSCCDEVEGVMGNDRL